MTYGALCGLVSLFVLDEYCFGAQISAPVHKVSEQ
jgi:hypothetical protein